MELIDVQSDSHEQVVRVEDTASGLVGFIAVHSTLRGPAAGGLRMRRYAGEAEALQDVLRLSRGMTYKCAAADLPLGGGKAVILGDPATDKTPARLQAMARAVDALGGGYWTAEDMGMTPADMELMAQVTPYVGGRQEGAFASGDPSPVTAAGIFAALRIAHRHRYGSDALAGRRVALQGLGHVGMHLAGLLREAGAELVVADPDAARVTEAVRRFGAEAVAAEAIYDARVHVFAPCAIGGVINAGTVARLKAGVVAGGANNQLARPEDGAALRARGILYAPDYIANAGGIVNVATEILRIADRPRFVAEKLAALERTMDRVLARAAAEGRGPEEVADATVEAELLKLAA